MPTINSKPIRCPWCGATALSSPSKGIWCPSCRNGSRGMLRAVVLAVAVVCLPLVARGQPATLPSGSLDIPWYEQGGNSRTFCFSDDTVCLNQSRQSHLTGDPNLDRALAICNAHRDDPQNVTPQIPSWPDAYKGCWAVQDAYQRSDAAKQAAAAKAKEDADRAWLAGYAAKLQAKDTPK
jgi:hypothetical protein